MYKKRFYVVVWLLFFGGGVLFWSILDGFDFLLMAVSCRVWKLGIFFRWGWLKFAFDSENQSGRFFFCLAATSTAFWTMLLSKLSSRSEGDWKVAVSGDKLSKKLFTPFWKLDSSWLRRILLSLVWMGEPHIISIIIIKKSRCSS